LFDAPLAQGPAEAVDKAVIGAWRCVAADEESTMLLTVAEQPASHYGIVMKSGTEAPDQFEGYAVSIDGARVVNVQEVGDRGNKKWTLVRYSLPRPNILEIEAARDEPFKGSDAPEARAAVLRKELRGKDLFQGYCVCIRTEKK
jgi:hypothetical protein